MSARDSVARMLTLVPWLLERPGASLAEAATAFGTDPATIRRELLHLDFCGLPGLAGGDLFEVELIGDRVVLGMADELTRPLRPTPQEAYRLVLTLDAAVVALGDELPQLRVAVDKVRSVLGIPEQQADVVPDDEDTALLAAARAAVRAERRVRLRYRGRGDAAPATREVDPWALDLVDGHGYLQGFDHEVGERRVFRLDRVLSLEPTDIPVITPAPEQLPPPRYVPSPDDLEGELRFERGARWLLDAIDADRIEDHDDGTTRCVLRTDAPEFIARLVLSGGGDLTVVRPAKLRARVRELAEAALAGYRLDGGAS